MAGGSMLEVIGELTSDPSARAALQEDPDGFLLDRGLDGFTAEDLRDAMDLSADALPVEVAAHLTGPGAADVGPHAGEGEHDALLRLLDHAAEAPLLDDAGADAHDLGDDLDFGTGSSASDSTTLDDDALEHADELAGQDDGADADGTTEAELEDLDDLVSFEEDQDATVPEPEDDGVQSEEVPDHWGDQHQDEGSLDPQQLGDDLGDLPGA